MKAALVRQLPRRAAEAAVGHQIQPVLGRGQVADTFQRRGPLHWRGLGRRDGNTFSAERALGRCRLAGSHDGSRRLMPGRDHGGVWPRHLGASASSRLGFVGGPAAGRRPLPLQQPVERPRPSSAAARALPPEPARAPASGPVRVAGGSGSGSGSRGAAAPGGHLRHHGRACRSGGRRHRFVVPARCHHRQHCHPAHCLHHPPTSVPAGLLRPGGMPASTARPFRNLRAGSAPTAGRGGHSGPSGTRAAPLPGAGARRMRRRPGLRQRPHRYQLLHLDAVQAFGQRFQHATPVR